MSERDTTDTLVRLETRSGGLVGWTRVRQRFALWPDVLVWGERVFRFAPSDGDADYRLYVEAMMFAIVTPVTGQRPPPSEKT